MKTVVEITDCHSKVYQAKTVRGKPVLTKCAVNPLKSYTDDEIVQLLNEMIDGKTVSSDDLIFAIPRRFVICKQMTLPSTQDEEIRKMANLQLVNQIPYNTEDVIFDYQIIERTSNGFSKILITAIHKDVNDRYLRIFNRIGIQPGRMIVSSFGILGWLSYQENKRKDFKEPLCVVNLDASHTEICFCHNRKLLFSRSINYGNKDINEESIHKLIDQIELSFKNYQKEKMGPDVSRILILSSFHGGEHLQADLQKRLNISVEYLTSLENVLSQKNIDLSHLKSQGDVSLTVGIGLLFAPLKETSNLLPQEFHERKKIKEKKKEYIKCAALLILILSLGFSVFGLEYYKKNQEWLSLKEETKSYRIPLQKAEKRIQFVDVFKKQINSRIFVPDIIDEVYDLIPAEVSIRAFHLDGNGQLTIQGYAHTGAAVNQFHSNLLNSQSFRDVNLQFSNQRRIFNMDVTDFKITSELSKLEMNNG